MQTPGSNEKQEGKEGSKSYFQTNYLQELRYFPFKKEPEIVQTHLNYKNSVSTLSTQQNHQKPL